MNINTLFNNRNKTFARLTEAGDYLGRRLRQNVVIFDVDDAQDKVTFVTEGNRLVSCTYREIKGRLTLDDFVVEDLDKITSDEAIDAAVDSEVSHFMEAIVADRYDNAEASFDSVIDAFTMRAKIEDSRKRLNKRVDRFNESYNIQNTKAYKKFTEALPLLGKFLQENLETLQQNSKLVEGLRLSKVVGETYDLPELALENLGDEFIVVPSNTKKTLYEMVCDKEVVRKELMEAKESFSKMWAKNDHIATLASHIYSNDDTIERALNEAVSEIPYLALSNKVDLTSVMDSVYQVSNPGTLSQKDIREFVNKIYEMKKPIKKMVIEALNSKYGVNVQSLRFVPSFKGLAEVQSQVFDILSEASDGGILSDVLKEFSTCMGRKGGVQVLDIANTVSKVMKEANFHVVDIDENFHMKKLSDYLKNTVDEAQYYGDDDKLSNDPGEGSSKKKKGKKDKDWGGNKGDIKAADRKKDDDSDLEADEKGDVDFDDADLPKNNKTKKGKKVKKGKKALDEQEGKEVHGKEAKEGEESEEDTNDGEPWPEKDEEAVEAEEVEALEDEQEEDAISSAQKEDFRELVGTVESVIDDFDLDLDPAEGEEEDVTQEENPA